MYNDDIEIITINETNLSEGETKCDTLSTRTCWENVMSTSVIAVLCSHASPHAQNNDDGGYDSVWDSVKLKEDSLLVVCNSVWDSLKQQLDNARPGLGLGINGGCDHSCRKTATEATVRYFIPNFRKMDVFVKADHLFVDCMSAAAARMDGEIKGLLFKDR